MIGSLSCQFHLLRIRCEERRLHYDFVTVIYDGFQHQIHGQTTRRSDEHLFVDYVHVIFFFIVFADRLAKLRIPAEIRVLRVACLCIGESRIDDSEICRQIRISQRKVDDIVEQFCHLI